MIDKKSLLVELQNMKRGLRSNFMGNHPVLLENIIDYIKTFPEIEEGCLDKKPDLRAFPTSLNEDAYNAGYNKCLKEIVGCLGNISHEYEVSRECRNRDTVITCRKCGRCGRKFKGGKLIDLAGATESESDGIDE